MSSFTQPIGPDPLVRAVQLARLEQQQAKLLAELAREAPDDVPVRGATAGGDERRLRGIPAVGRGCAGAIPGTRPGDSLFRQERKARRRG